VRKLLAVLVLGTALSALCQPTELPLRLNAINDYGLTLDRHQRNAMSDAITELKDEGIHLVYLATWRDPFSDPGKYARRVFSEWGLGAESALIVLVRDERNRWHAAGQRGEAAAARFDDASWEEFRSKAQAEANRGLPGTAAVSWATNLKLLQEATPSEEEGPRVWPAVLMAGTGVAVVVLLARRLLCPHCLRPLRQQHTWGGIIRVCPRCRYSRAGRRGSGPGSRRGRRP